jgi:hypothetical protein
MSKIMDATENLVTREPTPDAPSTQIQLPEARRPDFPIRHRDPLPAVRATKHRSRLVAVALLVGAVGVGTGGWYWLQASRALPPGLIQANGRIESDVVNVSGKLAGRIVTLTAREGDAVKAGAPLVQLDDRSVRARFEEAEAALATAAARLEAARTGLAVTRKEVPVAVAIAQASVDSAEAAQRRALAADAQNRRDADRAQRLVTDGSLPEQTAEQTGLLVLLIVMPIVTLSGTWTPFESMPSWLRVAMTLSPLRHFVDIIYSILLRGAGLNVLWDSVLAMTALGAVLFAVGLVRFRRQFV